MKNRDLSRRRWLKAAGALFLSASVGRSASARSAAEAVDLKPGQAQLFLDDFIVEKMDGLKRTMRQPTKRGAVIRSPDPNKTIQTRAAPAWDADQQLFKLWVMGIEETLWQSRDGLHWTPAPTPNLRIDQAVCDPVDPDPARRFKAAMTNQGFAVSPDGVHWSKLDVPTVQSSDESNFSYDPREGLFIHTVKRRGKYGRSVALAVSRDFQTWTDYGIVFQSDELDQQLGVENIKARLTDPTLQQPFHNDPQVYNVDVYNMGVFHYEGLYVGTPAMYHATGGIPNYPNTDGFHLVQLAVSRDLQHWQRVGERQPFIAPSRLDSGAYDLTQILPPSAPIVRDDELWFYYTGLKHRATYTYVGTYPNGESIPKPGLNRDQGAVCLAVLRRDGFVSLDADGKGGDLLTKPLKLAGSELLLNLNAGEQGDAVIVIFDEVGQPIAESQPITGDGVRLPVRWKTGDLKQLTGRKVRLKIHLRCASLYAVRVRE